MKRDTEKWMMMRCGAVAFVLMAVLTAMAWMLPTSCKGDGDSRPVLAVSIEPQRKILEELAGDRYQVKTMLQSGANPETYEPSVAQRMAAANAKAYFMVGYLPFEQTIAGGMSSDALVVNVSEGIEPLHGTHSHLCNNHSDAHADAHNHSDAHADAHNHSDAHADDLNHSEGHADDHNHGDVDPHTWTSLRNGKTIASNMLKTLIQLDPEHSDEYTANYQRLAQRLDSLDRDAAKSLKAAGAHAFTVWHPSLSYYARDYGLHQITVGQESKEVPISAMKAVIDEARADSVKVFFFQKDYDSRQAESINREIGSRLVDINPMAYDWEEEIIKVTEALSK